MKRSFVVGPDAVIACYEGQAADNAAMIFQLHPRSRVVAVPNGVNVEAFANAAPAEDVMRLRQSWRVVIAIFGHVSDVKGYGTFIDAAASLASQHKDCLFVAIGGETAQRGALRQFEAKVKEAGLADRFAFLGFRSDAASVLHAVDVVCLPSLAEGFPLAVLEAMAVGKPVVATPVGGVPEAVVHGKTGLLVPAGDSVALAGAIHTLVNSGELRQQMGMAGRDRVRDHFSVQRFARDVQQLYDTLLTNDGRRRFSVSLSR